MGRKRYILTYTLKVGGVILNEKSFTTIKACKSWLRRNKSKIYWSQMRHTSTRSNKPKIEIDASVKLKNYTKLKGRLSTYFETGMECLGLVFNEDGKDGYDGLHFIKHGHILKIERQRFLMVADPGFAKRDGYRFSFYPQGFSRKEIIDLISNGGQEVELYILVENV